MRKLLLILVTIIGLGIASFSYAMHINKLYNNGINTDVLKLNTGDKVVFSLSKQIDSIQFNKDSGFTIRTLVGGEWIDMSDNAEDYMPIQGYIIRNPSEGLLEITFTYSDITDVNDSLFQQTLKAGWNLVGPAFKNDTNGKVTQEEAFGNLPYSQIVDFTGNGFLKKGTVGYYSGEAIIGYIKDTYSGEVQINKTNGTTVNIKTNDKTDIRLKSELLNIHFVENIAYGVFVSNDTIMPGSQKTLAELETDDDNNTDSTYTALEAANIIAGVGLIVDHSDNTDAYELSEPLTKKEAIKILIKLSGKVVEDGICISPFIDVADDNWACQYVKTAVENGYLETGGNFNPDSYITHNEVLQLLVKIRGVDNDEGLKWKQAYINSILPQDDLLNNLLSGIQTKRGDLYIWLAEIVEADATEDDDDILDDLFGTGSTTVIPSVYSTFSTDDQTAEITLTDDWINDTGTGNILLKSLEIGITNSTSTGIIQIFNGSLDIIGTANIDGDGSLTVDIDPVDSIERGGEVYSIEASVQAEYSLIGNGISYSVDGEIFSTSSMDNLNLGTYIDSEYNPPIAHTGRIITNYLDDANADNEFDKQVLAGEDIVIGSVDVRADNEEVEVETVVFSMTGASNLAHTVENATLLIDGQEIGATGTNSNADITDTTITFQNLEGLIIPETTSELALKLNTVNIGEEFTGKTQTGLSITEVSFSDAKGVESGLSLSPSDISDFAGDPAKTLDIIPAIVVPAIGSTLGTDDQTAELQLIVESGNNTNETGDAIETQLTSLTFDVSNISGTGAINIFNDSGTQVGSSGVSTNGLVTVTINSETINNNDEIYNVEVNTDGIYKLAKNGVAYSIDGNTFSTKLENTLDFGHYSDSN